MARAADPTVDDAGLVFAALADPHPPQDRL